MLSFLFMGLDVLVEEHVDQLLLVGQHQGDPKGLRAPEDQAQYCQESLR